jgi:hypothetical protein
MNIKPHPAFEVVEPDAVAECWDGIYGSPLKLYRALWGCVSEYTGPTPEESEEPCIGSDCVADFWHKFTPEQQAELNRLAEARDAKWKAESAAIDAEFDFGKRA